MDKLYEEQMKMANLAAGDYFDQDGILCCGKCHTRKAYILKTELTWRKIHNPKVVRCLCACENKRQKEEAARYALAEHQKLVGRLQENCFTDRAFRNCRLNECDKVPGHILDICHQYVNHWSENRRNNCGLLLWGGVGNGKTTVAAAVANELMEREVPVLMRNFGSFLNATFEEKSYLFQQVSGAGLVVLDDFGMERNTEYGLEVVFQVVNARYNSKKPVIITTNLPLKTLKNPADIRYRRIYDRIIEMCVPVCFEEQSFRTQIHDEKMQAFKEQGKTDNANGGVGIKEQEENIETEN